MKVAVTGASGFLGVNLVRRLLDDGHEILALSRCAPPHLPRQVTYLPADVLEEGTVRAAFAAFADPGDLELVYHLAARITLAPRDELAWRTNTDGVGNVARAALDAGVRRFVHCSSIHAYDERRRHIDEASPRATDPTLPVYDRSKWRGEQILHEVIDAGLDAVITNPTGIYGPVDHGPSRLNRLVWDAARGRVRAVLTGGFDLVDVRDVVDALVLAAQRGRCGENYLLPGHHLSILELARDAAREAGQPGPAFAIPAEAVQVLTPVLDPVARRLGYDGLSRVAIAALLAAPRVDGTKARTELGVHTRPAAETIRDTVTFFDAMSRTPTQTPDATGATA